MSVWSKTTEQPWDQNEFTDFISASICVPRLDSSRSAVYATTRAIGALGSLWYLCKISLMTLVVSLEGIRFSTSIESIFWASTTISSINCRLRLARIWWDEGRLVIQDEMAGFMRNPAVPGILSKNRSSSLLLCDNFVCLIVSSSRSPSRPRTTKVAISTRMQPNDQISYFPLCLVLRLSISGGAKASVPPFPMTLEDVPPTFLKVAWPKSDMTNVLSSWTRMFSGLRSKWKP